jgi:hypothetical protein
MKDAMMDCTAINAEIASNTARQGELGNEKAGKFVQNFAAGFVGVFFLPAFFLIDAQGTQDIEGRALDARDQYLSTLALQRCPLQQQNAALR